MNNRLGKGRLRSAIVGNKVLYPAFSVLIFASTAFFTFVLADVFEAKEWFSVILAVAAGIIGFCCSRVWLDDIDNADEGRSFVVFAATLSFVGMVLTYITLGVYPFGDHTPLIIDMHHQYVSFFSLLRDRILSGNSLLYSDTLGLGGGFLPLFAYYLASPFNILMLLIPRANITEAIALVTVLKITAGGATFAIFAKNTFRRNDFSITLGGVLYSMIAFFICHSWNLMWLDPIILLPLVLLGLRKLLREGRPVLYCITLAMTLITNYYIGYMVCIYMVLCFVAIEITDGRRLAAADRLRRFWRFGWASLLGGGISAVITIPAFTYLMGTSGAEDSFSRDLASNFNPLALFQRSLFSAYPSMRGDNLPNIYCSVLAVFLLILFISCSNIPLRVRAAWGGVAAFLVLSMSVNWLNFAWHGFHFPNDLPYRFSFLLSFTMLVIAMQTLEHIRSITPRGVFAGLAAAALMLFIEQGWGDGKSTFTMLYGSLAFFIVYAVIIGLCAGKKIKPALCYALLLLVAFTEVTANASLLIRQLDENEYFTERDDFVSDYEIDREAFDIVESYGDSMYREELLPRKTCNDPSLFSYDGLTVFASSNSKSITTLMGKLGYAVNGVNSYLYKNFVPVSDSVLSLKYVVLNKEISNHHQLVPVETVAEDSDDKLEGEVVMTRYIHENTAALPKAFTVGRSIIGWDWENDNPFTVQNSLMTSASGCEDVYTPIFMYSDSYEFDASEGYDEYDGYDDMGDYDTQEPVGDVEEGLTTVSGYNCTASISGTYFSCSKLSDNMSANFTITQRINSAEQYFIYVDCRAASSINININSANGDVTHLSSSPNEPNITDLGVLADGASIDVTIYSDISCGGNIFLATLNGDVFDGAIEKLKTSPLIADRYSEGHIKGTVNAGENQMMFTSIPYDSGWTVRVDGEKVSTFALGDALLCFAVPEGSHTVEMRYFPSGLLAGIIITLLCIAILVVLLVDKLRRTVGEFLLNLAEKIGVVTVIEESSEELSAAGKTGHVDWTVDETIPDAYDDVTGLHENGDNAGTEE